MVLGTLVLGLGSCVESSKKYKALEAERDSLAMVASTATTDYESSLKTLNEIEEALNTIREAENIIMMENQEGNTNYAVAQIEAIDRTIQQNKAKVEELEKQLAESGSKSKQLNATITRLKNELDEKDTYINNLREELNASQEQVAQLTVQVEDLNKNVEDLNENINNLNAQRLHIVAERNIKRFLAAALFARYNVRVYTRLFCAFERVHAFLVRHNGNNFAAF